MGTNPKEDSSRDFEPNMDFDLDRDLDRNFDSDLDLEFKELFSAFDDVSASDELKASTLAAIAALQADEQEASSDSPAADDSERGGTIPMDAVASPKAIQAVSTDKQSQPTGSSTSGKGQLRNRIRLIRTFAIAACLALALTGGVAYAVPTAHVTLGEGDAAIELGVNIFGITVTAEASGDEGQRIVQEGSLCNVPYEQSVQRAFDAAGDSWQAQGFKVNVETGNESQGKNLEERTADFVENRAAGEGAFQDSRQDANSAQRNEAGGRAPDGHPQDADRQTQAQPAEGGQSPTAPASGGDGKKQNRQEKENAQSDISAAPTPVNQPPADSGNNAGNKQGAPAESPSNEGASPAGENPAPEKADGGSREADAPNDPSGGMNAAGDDPRIAPDKGQSGDSHAANRKSGNDPSSKTND